MPKWGLSMKEGSILKWIKSNGDNISKGDMILEIETEKVVNEMVVDFARVVIINAGRISLIAKENIMPPIF